MIFYINLFIIFLSLNTFSSDSNPHFEEQWYLKNTGQSLFYKNSDYELTPQIGSLGLDINFIEIDPKHSKETIVAVIDTGVDIFHPDLANRIWSDPNCKEENPILCKGKNFLNPKSGVYDDRGHGTHVAGIIAANNNDIGVKGITNSKIKIMPLKVLSQDVNSFSYKGRNVSDYFADAINYAVEHKASVINMSVGFPSLILTKRFRQAVRNAIANEVPIVVAAGNNSKNIPVFPCSLKDIICVGSVDNQGQLSRFSNYGHMIDILAPGEGILSTYPVSSENGPIVSRNRRLPGYEVLKGTSQAAPIVTGVLAMIKSILPAATVRELKARLLSNATDIDDKVSLNGIVDMKKSLMRVHNYIYPVFKENSQVTILDRNLTFDYNLLIQSHIGDNESVDIRVLKNNELELDNYLFSYKATEEKTINITGRFKSLKENSIVPLTFIISSKNFNKRFTVDLSFSMKPDKLDVKNVSLSEVNPKSILRKRGSKSYTSLNYVVNGNNETMDPEYFYSSKESRKLNRLNLIKVDRKELTTFNYSANETALYLIKKDLNLDGIDDYLFLTYYSSSKSPYFKLYYLNNNLQPLIHSYDSSFTFYDDSSVILFPDEGGNLLNLDKRLINFSWKVQALGLLGDFVFPVVIQNGITPVEDNSDNFTRFKQPRLSNKLYSLVPEVNNEVLILKPRLLVNRSLKKKIRKKLLDINFRTNPWDSFRLEKPLSQPSVDSELTYLLSVGEFNRREYFKITFTRSKSISIERFSLIKDYSLFLTLTGNNSFNVVNFNNTLNSDSNLFFKLEKRNKGRLVSLSPSQGVLTQNILSEGYVDPLFGFITSSLDDDLFMSIFESRFWIHFFTSSTSLKYPVNRESSFPGVSFSETMEGVFTKVNNRGSLGVFVNSTLLYGNQIHALYPSNNKVIRPLGFTIEVPSNCSYMRPEHFSSSSTSSLALVCLERNEAVLKFIKLDI